jgi:hypothetical protein
MFRRLNASGECMSASILRPGVLPSSKMGSSEMRHDAKAHSGAAPDLPRDMLRRRRPARHRQYAEREFFAEAGWLFGDHCLCLTARGNPPQLMQPVTKMPPEVSERIGPLGNLPESFGTWAPP